MSSLITPLRTAVTHPARDPLGALRRLLIVDALVCAVFAALVLAATGPLARLSGLPLPVLSWAGVILVVATAALGWAARMPVPAPPLVWLVTAINVGWVAASLAVLAVVPGLTATGRILIAVQAVIVAATVVIETRALSAQRAALAQSVPA